jgi:hypothetical protein
MTVEVYKDAPMPDTMFRAVNPRYADDYHAAIAKELGSIAAGSA